MCFSSVSDVLQLLMHVQSMGPDWSLSEVTPRHILCGCWVLSTHYFTVTMVLVDYPTYQYTDRLNTLGKWDKPFQLTPSEVGGGGGADIYKQCYFI